MNPRTLATSAVLLCAPLAIGAAQTAQRAAAAPSNFQSDVLAQFDDAAGKLEQLAQAIPQDKLTWRPVTGVRSVSEVLLHVEGANYYLLSFAGVKPSGTLPAGGETGTTDRAQILERMRRSFEHVRAAVRAMPAADLDKPTTMFGQNTTYRNVLLTTVAHTHEHLGQLIAYARMNGVVPPWSQ